MQKNKLCICELNECKVNLKNPVTLPCGFTICIEHVENYTDKFNCFLCDQEHFVPQKGFQLNRIIMDIVKSGEYLNESQNKLHDDFRELESIINNYEKLNSDVLIYDFFSKLRNKVDLHREVLLEKIHDRSDQIIKQLSQKEAEYKQNAQRIPKISFEELKNVDMLELNQNLRFSVLNNNDLKEISIKINNWIEKIKKETEKFENELLLDKKLEFIPKNDENFGYLNETKQSNLIIRNTKLLREFVNTKKADLIRSIKVIKNTSNFISCSNETNIQIWSFETGECIKSLIGHQNCVSNILLINDDKMISCSTDKTIKIWNLNIYECLKTLNCTSAAYSLCLISFDMLLIGCEDGTMVLWNLNNYSKLKTIKAHESWISCLKSKNESLILSCSNDAKIKLWNSQSFDLNKELNGHTNRVNFFEFIHDNNLLSCSHDKTIKFWDLNSGECLKTYNFDDSLKSIKLLTDNHVIVASSSKDNLVIFDLNKNIIIQKLTGHSSYVYPLELFNDGCKLLSGSDDGKIILWQIDFENC
jgi:hypothetical protein